MFIILLLIISQLLKVQNHSLFKKDFLNFRERERNINVWLPLLHPYWGPGLQPRHVS